MKRREFITLLGGIVAAWPLTARAQPAIPLIGFLSSLSPAESAHLVAGFRHGLSETEFVEGRNVAIEYRWADGQYDRLPALAADLVRKQVKVLVSVGGGPTMMAAKVATLTVPIVFATGTDPVRLGAVASFNRPGGNLTGVYILTTGLEGKRLGLLREFVPSGGAIAVLVNPNNTGIEAQLKDIKDAAGAIGQQIHVVKAANEREIDAAFDEIEKLRPPALLVASDPYLSIRRDQLIALAARHAIPTMYQWREFAVDGGLMSYGTNLVDAYRQVGVYAGRVLKGATPAEMPVLQPTKFELVINLNCAKALNLTIPPGVLAIADEVIE